MINVGILGYGTVGSGVFDILRDNSEIIGKRAGKDIKVKYVLDLRDFPGDPVEDVLVHDFSAIENDDDVQIVVETMGGLHPAYEFVKASLEKGKSVCTSNKALVAAFGTELIAIAKEKNVNFLFEASVGGGIPIIRPLQTSLAPDEIEQISVLWFSLLVIYLSGFWSRIVLTSQLFTKRVGNVNLYFLSFCICIFFFLEYLVE